MSRNKYAFKTLKERALTSGSAAVGLTVFGVTLASIFNPVALGLVGAYAAYKIVPNLLLSFPSYRDKAFEQLVASGHAQELSADEDICRITKEISDSLGRPAAPKVYTIDQTMITGALPFGFRWMAKLGPVKKRIAEKIMPKVFAALPGTNTLITTKEALASGLTEAQLRFAMAHEVSHLKADSLSPLMYGKAIVRGMSGPLLWGTFFAGILSLVGVGVPLVVGVGTLTAFGAVIGANLASKIAFNFGGRVVEKRADRNGLYITRDLDGAKSMMDRLHEPHQKKSRSFLTEALLDHPSYTKRMAALTKAFNHVSKYPALQVPVNDNLAVKPQQAPKYGSV